MNALTKFKDAENILGVCRHNLICELRRICKVIPIVDVYTRDSFNNFRIEGEEIYLLRGGMYNSFTVPTYFLSMSDEELKAWQIDKKLNQDANGYPTFGGSVDKPEWKVEKLLDATALFPYYIHNLVTGKVSEYPDGHPHRFVMLREAVAFANKLNEENNA